MGRRSGKAKKPASKGVQRRVGRNRAESEPENQQEQEMKAELESEFGEGEKPKIEGSQEELAAESKKSRKVLKPKPTRMRVVWGVFNTSVQCIQTFPYPQKKEAEELAAKLTTEKKSPYFVQPIKEPMEEAAAE